MRIEQIFFLHFFSFSLHIFLHFFAYFKFFFKFFLNIFFAKTSLLLKQAEWALRSEDPKTAAELYLGARHFGKAIEIAGKHGWAEMLLEIVRKLDKADREPLARCGELFRQMRMPNLAGEVSWDCVCLCVWGGGSFFN